MGKNDLTEEDVRRENIKLALGVFGKTVLVTIMSIFIYISLTSIMVGLTTKTIGYRLIDYDAEGNEIILEEHLLADEESSVGESVDEASSQLEESSGETSGDGETTTTTSSTARRVYFRNDMPQWAAVTQDVLCQIITLILLIVFPYTTLWSKGDRDKNNVNFGHMPEDKLRGLKVGLMASIPSLLAYIGLIVSKFAAVEWYWVIYKYVNMAFFPMLTVFGGGAALTSELSIGALALTFLPMLVVPLVCYGGYMLGYKQISVSEKFIYVNGKKKKKKHRRY